MLILHKQLIAFIIIGVINTLFGYGIYALFVYLGFHYALAAFFATCAGILFNFKTIGKFVFKNSDKKLFLNFVGVYFILYFINISLIKIIKQLLDNLYLTGFLAVIITAAIAFVLNKYIVFRENYETN